MHASGSSRRPRSRREPPAAGRGDDPPVALDAHRAGAGHDRVDGCSQPVEQRAVGAAAERPERPPSVAWPSAVLTMLRITCGRQGGRGERIASGVPHGRAAVAGIAGAAAAAD